MSKKKREPVDPEHLKPEDRMKFEIAKELGLADKVIAGGWRCLTAKESGRIGGLVTKKKREMSVKTQDVLYLTEHKEQARDHKENHIYKYQPTDQLLNQLMQRMSDHDKRDNPVMQESCPIYGVYSPVGRCGKTTFSLLLGELLARKRSVLYIGFDELPFWDEEENISEEQGEKGTLSDAYFYWQRQKLKEKLPVLVSHWH